jgi:ribosomal protein S13
MPINIGKSQILFNYRKGSFVFIFGTIFGIGKSVSRWVLANTGLPISAFYSNLYVPGPAIREQVINKLFFAHRQVPYFIFGRELKHLRFVARKKFFASNQIKSIRMQSGLPIWGQRTHSNARTARRRNRLRTFYTFTVVV